MDDSRVQIDRCNDSATAGLPGPMSSITAEKVAFAKDQIWQAVWLQYIGQDVVPVELRRVDDEFLLSDDPAEIRAFQDRNPHDCENCRRAAEVGVALLEDPDNQMVLLVARLTYDAVWPA